MYAWPAGMALAPLEVLPAGAGLPDQFLAPAVVEALGAHFQHSAVCGPLQVRRPPSPSVASSDSLWACERVRCHQRMGHPAGRLIFRNREIKMVCSPDAPAFRPCACRHQWLLCGRHLMTPASCRPSNVPSPGPGASGLQGP